MRLHNAAKFFDKDPIYDGYSGRLLYRGQFASYDGAQPDGTYARRRTLSLAPNLVAPTRNVVQFNGERWVVGEPNSDSFLGSAIRQTYKCKRATDKFDLLTPGQACINATATTSFYAHTMYLKDTVDMPTTSDYSPFYEVSVSSTETVLDGSFLRSTDRLLHIRSVYKELEGFLTLACDEIYPSLNGYGQVVDVYGQGYGYDPVLDNYGIDIGGSSLPAATTGLVLDRYKQYDKRSPADASNMQGDITIIVPNSYSVINGQRLSLVPTGAGPTTDTFKWRVISSTPYLDATAIHARNMLSSYTSDTTQ